MTQAEHVLKTTCVIFVENSRSCYEAQKTGFLLSVIILFHRAKTARWEKGRELWAAEAFFIILPCRRQVADPLRVGDPSSGRVIGKMTFIVLDCADVVVNWKNIWNTWILKCRPPWWGGPISSSHLLRWNQLRAGATLLFQGLQSFPPILRLRSSAITASVSRLSWNACPTALSHLDVAWMVNWSRVVAVFWGHLVTAERPSHCILCLRSK